MERMNMDELRRLKDKAIVHVAGGGSTPCKWLYRNKSHKYYQEVLIENKGVMRTYVKDNSGDQRSPTNGRLNGLFFMARHENGEPPMSSPFGPVRLQVPADELLRRAPNIYFTDFYCMQSNWHYVTLVATSYGSSAYRFCRDNLLPVSLHDENSNPFLFYRQGQLYVSNKAYLHVELFFTDDIRVFRNSGTEGDGDIFNADLLDFPGAQMKQVPTFGRGSSTPGGLQKDVLCSTCNLSVQSRRTSRVYDLW